MDTPRKTLTVVAGLVAGAGAGMLLDQVAAGALLGTIAGIAVMLTVSRPQ